MLKEVFSYTLPYLIIKGCPVTITIGFGFVAVVEAIVITIGRKGVTDGAAAEG
jgi:hypothetical protein